MSSSEFIYDSRTDASDLDVIVDEARSGSDSAFIKLWRIFYPKMLRFLQMFTQDAEDLCSEAWIRIAGAIKGFVGNAAAFQGWIFTIARNLAIDHQRKQKTRGDTVELEESHWVGYDASQFDVEDLLRALSVEQAEIISLRIVVGLDVETVSEITGKSASNVRVITHRALAKLREVLSEGGEK